MASGLDSALAQVNSLSLWLTVLYKGVYLQWLCSQGCAGQLLAALGEERVSGQMQPSCRGSGFSPPTRHSLFCVWWGGSVWWGGCVWEGLCLGWALCLVGGIVCDGGAVSCGGGLCLWGDCV